MTTKNNEAAQSSEVKQAELLFDNEEIREEARALSTIRFRYPETIAEMARHDPAQVAKYVENFNQAIETCKRKALQKTYPEDWLIHVGRDGKGYAFLQDKGCARAMAFFGLHLKVDSVERKERDDGTFSIVHTGTAYSSLLGITLEGVIGTRWSGAEFFKDKPEGLLEDEVTKASRANFDGRGVRKLLGVMGIPEDELARYIEVAAIPDKNRIGYKTGEEARASGKQKGLIIKLMKATIKDLPEDETAINMIVPDKLTKKEASQLISDLMKVEKAGKKKTLEEFKAFLKRSGLERDRGPQNGDAEPEQPAAENEVEQ